jgi:hypothetical protein
MISTINRDIPNHFSLPRRQARKTPPRINFTRRYLLRTCGNFLPDFIRF